MLKKILNKPNKVAIVIAIASIVSFLLGFIISKSSNIPKYYIKKEIDPVAVLSIIVTISLGYYLSVIIDGGKEIKKRDIEITINRLERIVNNCETFTLRIQSNNIAITEAVSFVKHNYMAIGKVLINYSARRNLSISEHEKNCLKWLRDLKELMTYTPVTALSFTPISVTNGIATYSNTRIALINQKLDDIVDELIALEFFVNNSSD